jgi:hypothetical protein
VGGKPTGTGSGRYAVRLTVYGVGDRCAVPFFSVKTKNKVFKKNKSANLQL